MEFKNVPCGVKAGNRSLCLGSRSRCTPSVMTKRWVGI